MPQLNMGDYLPQLVWLVITFVILFLIMWKLALPRVASVLETRKEKIDSDLEGANSMKREAEKVLAAYEASLSEARASAQTTIAERLQEMAAAAGERKTAFEAKLAEQTAADEARVAAARDQAMANIRDVAAGAAQAATARLIGVDVDKTALDAAIDAEMAREG